MNYFELALEAKRNKDFSLALDYYQKELDTEGISVNLLNAIAKVYYLLHNNSAAVKFYLAATHLEMHQNNLQLLNGDKNIELALQQVPEEIASQVPHPVGATLFYNYNIARHISHALIDHEETYEKFPEFRKYAEVYYSAILGDGSHDEILQKHELTAQDQKTIDDQYYIDIGFQLLIDSIKWSEIENLDVVELYLS